MLPKTKTYTLQTVSTTVLAAAQTTPGAASFVMATTASTDDMMHKVTLTSTGNISGVTFTISSVNPVSGVTISETLAGPNNNTVTSASYHGTGIAISVNGAVGTNTSAGISAACASPRIIGNYRSDTSSVYIFLSGTATYTLQYSNERDNLFSFTTSPNWIDCTDTDVVSATATSATSNTGPVCAYRLTVASYSSDPVFTVTYTWAQANQG